MIHKTHTHMHAHTHTHTHTCTHACTHTHTHTIATVYLCNVGGTQENHYSLDLHANLDERFGIFALRFSSDNKEILAS